MRIPRWLNPWRTRREQEEDLARELDTHLAIASDEQQEGGFSPVGLISEGFHRNDHDTGRSHIGSSQEMRLTAVLEGRRIERLEKSLVAASILPDVVPPLPPLVLCRVLNAARQGPDVSGWVHDSRRPVSPELVLRRQ